MKKNDGQSPRQALNDTFTPELIKTCFMQLQVPSVSFPYCIYLHLFVHAICEDQTVRYRHPLWFHWVTSSCEKQKKNMLSDKIIIYLQLFVHAICEDQTVCYWRSLWLHWVTRACQYLKKHFHF